MSRTAIGVFATSEAERLLDELVSRGFPTEGISLLSHDEGEARPGMPIEAMSEPSGPFAGLAGHLLGLHAASVSGIGPSILAGPIADAVESSQTDVADCLFVALCDEGVPEGTARAYTDEVRRGAALVAIRVADQDLPSALDVLRRHHARATEDAEGRSERARGAIQERARVEAEGRDAREMAEEPVPETRTGKVGAKEKLEETKEKLQETKAGAEDRLNQAKEGAREKFASVRASLQDKIGKKQSEPSAKPERTPAGEIGETQGEGERAFLRAERTEQPAGDMSMPVDEPEDRGATRVLVVERQIIVQPIEEERGVDEPIEEERRTGSAQETQNVPSAESEPRAAATQANPDPHEESFREHFAGEYGKSGADYEQYSPAYRYGHNLSQKTTDREWHGVEPQAKAEWEAHNPDSWERFKTAIRHAWHRAMDRTKGKTRHD